MEAKLSQKSEIPIILKSRVLRSFPNPTISPHSCCFESGENKKRVLAKGFPSLTEIHTCVPSWIQRWKFHVRERSKGRYSTNQFFVHVVKEGETLTSISRSYGVSIQSVAAANAQIVNIDLVLEGQHLNIPSSMAEDILLDSTWKSWLYRIDGHGRSLSSLNIWSGHKGHKIFTMLSTHCLPPAKANGYFLLLVPLIAFCITCIISGFHHRVAEYLRHRVVNEADSRHPGSRNIRWKIALSDIREPDVLDAASRQDSVNPQEDQSQVPFEEISHAYTKLEPAYEKFLSECGISKWGYWRGGSPE